MENYIIPLCVTVFSFLLGYFLSSNRLKANDIEWLRNRLKELGYSEPTNEVPTALPPESPSGLKKKELAVADILESHRQQIRTVFFNVIKENLKESRYTFSDYNDVYNKLPVLVLSSYLYGLRSEFLKENPTLTLDLNFKENKFSSKPGQTYVIYKIDFK